MSDDEQIELALYGDETVRILINDNVKMSPKKMAAQAVHAALNAYGIPHGRVVVLGGSKAQVMAMDAVIADAGFTEIAAGTVTAGARLERDDGSSTEG